MGPSSPRGAEDPHPEAEAAPAAPCALSPVVLERFARCQPSSIRLTEFLAWDGATQEAVAQIFDGEWGMRIYALAQAIEDEGARLALMAKKDGGRGLESRLIDAALDAAQERLQSRKRAGAAAGAGGVPIGRSARR